MKKKCDEFLQNTDLHFAKRKIVNFDMVNNEVQKNIQKQYQTIDHEEIKQYPPKYQEQICSSILRNVNKKDMFVQKKILNEHFNKKPPTGWGRFFKKIKDDLYKDSW